MPWREVADVLSGIDVGTVILWIVVTCVLLGVLRRAWPALRKLVEMADDLAETRRFRAEIRAFKTDTEATLTRFSRQLENNHPEDPGLREEVTTARTTITDVEKSVGEMKRVLEDLRTKVYRDHSRLQALEAAAKAAPEEKEEP